jgi:tetratricopeptide (TPR) repeat protein
MFLSPATAGAQACRERANSHRLLVVTFAGPKTMDGRAGGARSALGMQVADTIRQLIARNHCPPYFPIAAADIERTLIASGYPVDTAISAGDVKELARTTASSVVLWGSHEIDGRAWTIKPMLMDPTDEKITQPLPSGTHASRVRFAVTDVLSSAKPVMDLMPQYTRCRIAAKEGRYQEAITAGKAVLEAYPNSTMARVCIASVYEQMPEMPMDSILSLTNAVLAINPDDYYAVRLSEVAERKKGNLAKANELIVRLYTLDPLNVDLQEDVIKKFAAAEDYTSALKFVSEFKAKNPGEQKITNLEALICFATKDYKCAIAAYEELEKTADTTIVNIQFYERLVKSYRELNLVKEASNAAGRAVVRYPQNVNVIGVHAQLLREAGDTTASIAAARKALALDPSKVDLYLQIAGGFGGKVDSIIATLSAALPHAKTQTDSAAIQSVAFSAGQALFNLSNPNMTDSTKRTDADLENMRTTIKYMEFADQAFPSDGAKFYQAVAHFHLGFVALTQAFALQAADPARTCLLATEAYERSAKSRDLIQAGGGRSDRNVAGNLLQAIDGNAQTMNELKAKHCKPGLSH